MVLSIYIGCMQGCQYISRVSSRLITPAVFQRTYALQHSFGNYSAETSNGFLCRGCSSSDSDRHGHWESSAFGLRGRLYRICYRYMLYIPPSVLSMASQDIRMGWFCSCWAFGELKLPLLLHMLVMAVLINHCLYSSSMPPSSPSSIYFLTWDVECKQIPC